MVSNCTRRQILTAGGGVAVGGALGAITVSYKRPISTHFGDMANLADMVPDQMGSADVIAHMHAIRRDSPFRPFFVPPGKYRCATPLPIIAGPPLSIYGWGSNGDGPAEMDYKNSVLFVPSYASGDVFTAVTDFPCHFENFRIETDAPFRDGFRDIVSNSGAGIRIAGNGGNAAGSIVRGIGVVEKDIGIDIFKSSLGEISTCAFNAWKTAGIRISTDRSREGAGGFVCHNRFFGHDGTLAQQASRGPCVFLSNGYTWIYANNMTGGTCGVQLRVKNYPAGAPRIYRNTIEDFWIAGVMASTEDGTLCSMLEIEDNEFSLVSDRPNLLGTILIAQYTDTWLTGFSVSRNRIRNHQQSQTTKPMISIQGGVGGKINDNRLTSLSPNAQAGISINGATTNAALGGPIEAFDNQYYAESGGSWSFRLVSAPGLVLVRDQRPFRYADLKVAYPNIPADGSSLFVSDGMPGSAPLRGGGTGTPAHVVSGQLVGR